MAADDAIWAVAITITLGMAAAVGVWFKRQRNEERPTESPPSSHVRDTEMETHLVPESKSEDPEKRAEIAAWEEFTRRFPSRFSSLPWWPEVVIGIPEEIATWQQAVEYVKQICGKDTGDTATWRTAAKIYALASERWKELPVFVAHCFATGGEYRDAARLYADLFDVIGTMIDAPSKWRNWYLVYLSHNAGKYYHKIEQHEDSARWYRRAIAIGRPYHLQSRDSREVNIAMYAHMAKEAMNNFQHDAGTEPEIASEAVRNTAHLTLEKIPVGSFTMGGPHSEIGGKKNDCLVNLELAEIPAGSFMMGSPDSESARNIYEEFLHEVAITRTFLMCTTPVTHETWVKVMGKNPSHFRHTDWIGIDWDTMAVITDANRPVENISWFDAVRFCNKLSDLAGLALAYGISEEEVTWNQDANGYRLPTEAEWEYACRAGTTTAYNTGNSESDLARAGWYGDNSGRKPQAVKKKEPNAWGLFDMHGNVFEWCWDWRADYPTAAVADPIGPIAATDQALGKDRVVRGGSYGSTARYCRSANRHSFGPNEAHSNVGFRPVRSAP